MKRLIFGALLMAFGNAYGQSVVSGKILDAETDQPIPKAQVIVAGTTSGIATNINGEFSIAVNLSTDSLLFSYVGYKRQQLKAENNMVVRLEMGGNLEEVIIRGVRAAANDPVTQSNVNRKVIEEQYNGEQPIYLLEKVTPSIFSFSESGTRVANYGNLRMRGIGQERINMTLNGIPLNDMIDHGVFFSNFTDIGNSFESIQVQRGVGTSTNGVASYAGSINFESVNIEDREAGGELQLGAGSFGTYRMNANVSSGLIDDRWAFYGSFSRLYSDGFRDNTFTDARSFFFSGGYFGEKDAIKITAFDSRSRNGLGYSPVLESDLNADPTTNYLDENDTDDFGQQLVQIQHTHQFSNQLTSISSVYYGAAGGDFFFTYNLDPTTKEQINFPLYNDHYGIMSNIMWNSLDRSVNISSGIHLYRFDRINEEALSPELANPYYNETSVKDEFSWFAKLQWAKNKWQFYTDLQIRSQSLTINPDYVFLGIPSEGAIERDWTFFNPKVGLSYQLNEQLQAYGSFGRTGREPTRIDIIGGFTIYEPSLDQAQQDDFEPEFVNNVELGLRLNKQYLSLAANYFYMGFENEIAPIGELLPFGVQKRTNIPNSFRTGIELEAKLTIASNLSAFGNLTYMSSGIDDFTTTEGTTYTDATPILTPEWLGNAGITYRPVPNLGVTLSGQYVGESFLDLSNSSDLILPSFFVADLRINYQIGPVAIIAEANNLADDIYYSSGAPVDVDFDGAIDGPGYLVNAGRNYFLTVKFSF